MDSPNAAMTSAAACIFRESDTSMIPFFWLRFLSRNAVINIGATVYSSGDGGVFPPGLQLGKVKRFENREISGEAVVEPVVDFQTIEHVFVIEMQRAGAVPAQEPPVQKALPVPMEKGK